MKKLNKPQDIGYEIYSSCISSTTSNKPYYESISHIIFDAEAEYETKATANTLHTMPDRTQDVGAKELEYLYDSKMVSKKGPCRGIYDKIKLLSTDGTCPLCNQRVVSTLDHYLPKTHYPELAVTPINLVPACKDCNFIKLSKKPTSSIEETFHPYYDDFGNAIWLEADLVQTSPPCLVFKVIHPNNWTPLKHQRAKHHFDTFFLGELYTSHAARELANIKFTLNKLFQLGPNAVQSHLDEQRQSYEANDINSWQSAMFRCLSNSNWFCNNIHSIP